MIISIVVVTHLESNKKYLDSCLQSIANQTLSPDKYETIVVSSGEYQPSLAKWCKGVHVDTRMHYPEAVNYGVKHTDPKSKYLLILNDDTILTKESISNMLMGLGDSQIILNPLSNCDNHFMYNLILGYERNGQFETMNKRFYRYDEWEKIQPNLMNARSIYPPGIVARDFVCFYATIIPRSVWNKVGELDPNFKTGQDDVDYCRRAKKLGIASGVALQSIIWL